jgi:NSS family neurotransmitter:Na+ symporter
VITVADLLVAILGGLVVFPVVFSFGVDPAAGVQLAFVTLPQIFQEMSFGLVVGTGFFLLLFLAALTSAVSILEVPVATLMEVSGLRRKRAALVVTLAVVLAGLPSALSYTPLKLQLFGVPFLDLQDFVFGTIGIIAAGVLLSVCAGWFLGPRTILDEIGGGRRWNGLFMLIVRVIIPLVLLVNLGARLLGPR